MLFGISARAPLVALCLVLAACGTSSVETVEAPDAPLEGYRAIVVTVPLERGIDKELSRKVEAAAATAVRSGRRWRLVLQGSLAAGQRQGLGMTIDLDETASEDAFKAFTNTVTATVSLQDIATGERLGGVTLSANGASVEFAAIAVAERAAEWVLELP